MSYITVKVEPCPKCGSKFIAVGSTRIGNRFASAKKYYVRCEECGYKITNCISELGAVKTWNKESENERNI